MGFTKFVEVGRVVSINYGKYIGKIAVVVDLISTTKVLIDGPNTGIRRQEMSIKRISLTEFKINIKRAVHKEELVKAINEFKLADKIKASIWGRKQEKRIKRANLTDFDRFKVKLLRQQRSILRGKALKPQKK